MTSLYLPYQDSIDNILEANPFTESGRDEISPAIKNGYFEGQLDESGSELISNVKHYVLHAKIEAVQRYINPEATSAAKELAYRISFPKPTEEPELRLIELSQIVLAGYGVRLAEELNEVINARVEAVKRPLEDLFNAKVLPRMEIDFDTYTEPLLARIPRVVDHAKESLSNSYFKELSPYDFRESLDASLLELNGGDNPFREFEVSVFSLIVKRNSVVLGSLREHSLEFTSVALPSFDNCLIEECLRLGNDRFDDILGEVKEVERRTAAVRKFRKGLTSHSDDKLISDSSGEVAKRLRDIEVRLADISRTYIRAVVENIDFSEEKVEFLKQADDIASQVCIFTQIDSLLGRC